MARGRPTAPYLTRRRWTATDARAALADWRASRLALRTFAQRVGLDAQRLYRWRRVLEAEPRVGHAAAAPEFVEIRPAQIPSVEIVLRSGRLLRVAETIDSSVLARLARALEEESSC